jgi:hypothetical protein
MNAEAFSRPKRKHKRAKLIEVVGAFIVIRVNYSKINECDGKISAVDNETLASFVVRDWKVLDE